MSLLSAFNNFLALGWIPFSIRIDFDPNAGKKVIIPPKSWQKFTASNTHFDPSANGLAIKTGKDSMLFVLDSDNTVQLENFLKTKGFYLPPTVVSITGSGGRHYFFKWSEALKSIKSSSKVLSLNGQKLDVDIRSYGGMIITPPSSYTKSSTSSSSSLAEYSWLPGHAPGEIEIAECPEWLINELKSKTKSIRKKQNTPSDTSELNPNTPEINQTFPVFKSLQDYVLKRLRILPAKLDKIIYYPESETFNVQTTEKLCVFAAREHTSNHQYLVISKTGRMVQRCHSDKLTCSGKENDEDFLPEDIVKELHSLINLSEPISKEILELAKTDAKALVNDYFIGNDNMHMVVHDDKSIGGVLKSVYGKTVCPFCNVGKILSSTSSNGIVFKCDNAQCTFKLPAGNKLALSYNSQEYPNLHQYMQIVFNIGSINITNNNYSVAGKDANISWNEFVDDHIQIVDDEPLNFAIIASLSGTHSRLADLLYHMNKSTVVHCSGSKKWYVFEQHIWKNVDDVYIRRLLKSPEITNLLIKAKHTYQTASSVSQKEAKIKQIQRVITQLENTGFQNSVIQQFEEPCHKGTEEFLDLLDKKRHLLGFTNGIYDLNTGEFRKGSPEDKVTMTVGYDYDPIKMNDENLIKEFNSFFFKVFPDVDVAKYVIKFLGSCLAGYTKDQIFSFGFGTGSNGKGILINLMALVLGGFAAKIDASFLCGGMPESDKPTPTLTRLVGKRFVYISEVVESAKLNEQLFKALCGEEKMPYRPMYGEQREFMPDFKMFMVCNSLPNFNGSDYAMKRRIRVIPFESTFVDASESSSSSKYEYVKDPSLNEKLDSWKHAVMGLLIQAYQLYKEEGLSSVPERMKSITQTYFNDNDIYTDFVKQVIVFGDPALPEFKTLTRTVYNKFAAFAEKWKYKVPRDSDLCNYLLKAFDGKAIKRNSRCTELWGSKTVNFFEGLKVSDSCVMAE